MFWGKYAKTTKSGVAPQPLGLEAHAACQNLLCGRAQKECHIGFDEFIEGLQKIKGQIKAYTTLKLSRARVL